MCCKDLLSYSTVGRPLLIRHHSINFTHRTVLDFLRTPDMQCLINAHVPGQLLDDHLLSNLLLAGTKTLLATNQLLEDDNKGQGELQSSLVDYLAAIGYNSLGFSRADQLFLVEKIPLDLLLEHSETSSCVLSAVSGRKSRDVTPNPFAAASHYLHILMTYLITRGCVEKATKVLNAAQDCWITQGTGEPTDCICINWAFHPSAVVIGFDLRRNWHEKEVDFDLLEQTLLFETTTARCEWQREGCYCEMHGHSWNLFLRQLNEKQTGCWSQDVALSIARVMVKYDVPGFQTGARRAIRRC
jgi:hypothetical protein